MKKLIKSLGLQKSTAELSYSEDEGYTYTSLEGPRDIRLLHVYFSKTVICELISVSLDCLPGPYTAVSYRWDTTSFGLHRVPCGNKQILPLGETLYSILEHVSKDSPSFVWIDALCINQTDPEEKGRQVSMMYDIYSYASRVLIWLGAPDVISNMAMDTVRELEGFFRQVDAHDPAAMELLARFRVLNLVRVPSNWQNLGKLLQREWFQRIWIIQEVVSGTQVVMVCGNQSLPWETFSYVMTRIGEHGLHDLLKQDNTTPWGLMNTVLIHETRDIRLQKKHLSLQFMLLSTLEFKASDWRDKVFALLGIATRPDHKAMDPDYTKSPEEVYTLTAKYLLTHYQDLSVLSAAGTGRPRSFPNLPSWASDWGTEFRAPSLAFVSESAGFSATKNLISPWPTIVQPTTLVLQGMIIDIVDKLAPMHPIPLQGSDQHNTTLISQCTNEALHSLQQSQHLASTLAPYPTGDQDQDAYWRTLIANMSATAEPAPATLGPSFQAWLSLLHYRAQWNVGPRTQPSMQDIQQADMFRIAFSKHGLLRRFFTTHGGYMGIGPPGIADRGVDVVALLLGATSPFILRENSASSEVEAGRTTYSLVGECYVHGLMNGEEMDLGEVQQIRLC